MKTYPKVPRFDHPTVEDSFFEASDLEVIEKVDGSNFRFALYDSNYADWYDLQDVSAKEGDVIIGSKKVIRGVLNDPIEDFDGNFRRAIEYLRKNLNKDKIKEYHKRVGGPLVFFAENMVFHTLDYEYEENPPPGLLGFDIYTPARDGRDSIPPDPFKETFEGFLDIDEAREIFGDIGIPFIHNVDKTFEELLEGDFPKSNYADKTVEGVVLRNDDRDRRVKMVRDEFKELNRKAFGLNEDDATNGEEVITARYCTNARIRKIVRKMVVDEGKEFSLHLNNELYERVYEDMWAENWHEIKDASVEFTPSKIKPLVAERCIETLRRMKTNAKINDVEPQQLWRDI